MASKEIKITRDEPNNKLVVVREFEAPLAQVWKAWTDSTILDQWWAPKPWKARTKSMDFKIGSMWLYAMEGPDGSKQYCRVEFTAIDPQKSFSVTDSFCDEQAKIDTSLPPSDWIINFSQNGNITTVNVTISFANKADMDKLVGMGFETGFTAGLGNLERFLLGQPV